MATDPPVAAKVKIADSLKAFQSGALAINAVNFFESLGYSSDKTHELESNTAAGLLELANQPAFLNPAKAHAEEWKTVDFLFQLTDEEIRNFGRGSLEFDSTVDVAVGGKHIESYIFFAIELEKDSYTRTDLADTTREINRLFPMPALVLFKHGESLTLSIINRRIHKRDIARDVLEKVTLIKDLNINNPHRGHIEILFDLALPQLIATHEVTNFVQLDDAWRKTLDTSVLNKRFYKELANWYFWALQNVEFPKQEGVTDDVNRATNVIRLITRLIFVWFLKERELVPDALFDRASLDDLLKDLSPDKSTFYKAILQNLFFATLNTPMNDPNAPRVFRSETNGKRFNDQYMVHNQYRHQKLFKDPEHALEIFAGIPFLNGGLFECLDKPAEVDGKKLEIRIDGFSDVAKKQPTVPNKLFFGGEERIDLNETYGTRGKRYSVCGLIETLDRYKFTIAENTPIEEEVALDPELLGRVFENLLASYNPETGATARKQTGSFYTPREIVNYMVDESLIAYLETQLKSESKDQNGDDLNERLRQLFAYSDERHQFSAKEIDKLIAAIDDVKILDPACGSGAFPMGILQRCVFILSKLDPKNVKWEQRQIERVREVMRAAERIEDHRFRENTLNDLKAQIGNIEDAFARNELDYGRKLFLIENCIYGVDIQPIAIQIAKLRFFISLIIDQRIRAEADNLGIRPLPNLETKFVAANTLLTIDKPAQAMLQNEGLRSAIEQRERELKLVRERHFTARTTRTKDKYRREDDRLRHAIGSLLEQDHWPPETTAKLVAWNPYDQNASAGFLDVEWMFGIRNGFDIVIGNPPYGANIDQMLPILRPRYRDVIQNYADSFKMFFQRGMELAISGGILAFITPNVFLSQPRYKDLRKYLLNFSIEQLVNLGEDVFEQVVYVCLSFVRKEQARRFYKFADVSDSLLDGQLDSLSFQMVETERSTSSKDLSLYPSDVLKGGQVYFEDALEIKDAGIQYHRSGIGLKNKGGNDLYERLFSESSKTFQRTKPVWYGRLINSYWISERTDEFFNLNYEETLKHNETVSFTKTAFETSPKIIWRQTASRPQATIDYERRWFRNTIQCAYLKDGYKSRVEPLYLLGVLNSKYIAFVYNKIVREGGRVFPQVKITHIKKLPLAVAQVESQRPIIVLVERILAAKEKDANADTSELERQIDGLVYKLYGLTPDEIAIVESSQ